MNKNFLSKFAVLTLVAGIFGYMIPSVFAAAPTGTLTGVLKTIACGASSSGLAALTVTDTNGQITTGGGIRIRIQSTTNAMFDNTVSSITRGGAASTKVDAAVTYSGDNKTLLVVVNSNFTSGDVLTISGLSIVGGNCVGIGSTSAKPLQWAVDGSSYSNADSNTSITVTKVLSTSTNISNEAPTFTTNANDDSSATTPTNVGALTTWTATARDPNADTYYLIICDASDATPNNGAAPTCTGGVTWGVSASPVASEAPATVTRLALDGDTQSHAWYAFACDNNASNAACSNVSGAGSTNSTPFNVNHVPVIGTVTDGNTYGVDSEITPGNDSTGKIYFQIGVTDPDNETTQDTISYYICNAATTSFDSSTGACTGGTTIGSGTGVTTGTNGQNNSNILVPIPTHHENGAAFKIFLRDSHNFADGGNGGSYAYVVEDVAPVVGTYMVNDINPTAGGSVATSFSVIVTDDNGDDDIVNVKGLIYDTVGSDYSAGDCTAAEKFCYRNVTCTPSDVGSGADVSMVATCNFTTWYNITPTTPGAWKARAVATDSKVNTTIGEVSGTSIAVASLSAVAVNEASIAYTATAAGSTSATDANSTTTLQNAGNIAIDVGIHGSDMTRTGGNGVDIPLAKQKWGTALDFIYASAGYALVGNETVDGFSGAALGCSDRNIAVRNVVAVDDTDSPIYWKIQIPATQASGSYTGTNTFTSIVGSMCSGGI